MFSIVITAEPLSLISPCLHIQQQRDEQSLVFGSSRAATCASTLNKSIEDDRVTPGFLLLQRESMEARRDKWSSIQDSFSQLFSLPCLWFEGKKFSREKIYIWVCFHLWKHVGAKNTFRSNFLVTWFFLFVAWNWVKVFFPRNQLDQIFSVRFLKFFFFFF